MAATSSLIWPMGRTLRSLAPAFLAFGAKALELIAEKQFGHMVAFTGSQIVSVPLKEATGQLRTVPLDGGFITTARSLGICLGD